MKKQMVLAGLLAANVAHADLLVAPGSKATLTVEYSYVAAGKKADRNDSHEWNAKRLVTLTAELIAQKQQPIATMRAMESGQAADMKEKQSRAQSAATKMSPMMADMEKIVAKCGDNEACISKEVASYGLSMQMTPELKSAGDDIAAVGKQGALRYQSWRAATHQGSYSIEESAHKIDADPICMEIKGANARCTRDESRKGNGPIPSERSAASLEIDAEKKDMVLQLPVAGVVAYTETIATNKPGDKGGTAKGVMHIPAGFNGLITVPLRGANLNQSGEQVIKSKGEGSESGTLTVRWRLAAQ